jgi:hypothetical protein
MVAPSSSTPTEEIGKSSVPSERSELKLGILVAIVSLLLFIGLLEGLAYLYERMQANGPYAWELVASRRIVLDRHPGSGFGYTLMRPGKQYEWGGIPVVINSHGLRGPEITYEKPPNTFRILNLGDSVTMGWGVREEETYGRRLESILNESGQNNGLRFQVINAGVPGWNLENAAAYLQAEGLKYRPDLVLLDLTTANDIRGHSALEVDNQPGVINWLQAKTYFWPLLTVQLRWMESRAEGRDRIDVIDPPTDPDEYFPLDPNAENWTRVWKWVTAINQLAKENDARFLLVMFPVEFQVTDEDFPTLPQEMFMAKSSEAGITTLDLLPAYRKACREKPGGACQREDRYLFADVWMHPSAYGHELTADEIYTALAGFLPE